MIDYKEQWIEFYSDWVRAQEEREYDEESWEQMCEVASDPEEYANRMLQDWHAGLIDAAMDAFKGRRDR